MNYVSTSRFFAQLVAEETGTELCKFIALFISNKKQIDLVFQTTRMGSAGLLTQHGQTSCLLFYQGCLKTWSTIFTSGSLGTSCFLWWLFGVLEK